MSDYNNDKDKLDQLETLLRKSPQLTKPKTKIPIDNDKYPQLWFDHQEDLVL